MIFYVLLDTSGSMEGAKIAAVNDAMSNLVSELKQISNLTNLAVDLNVLSFGKQVKWKYDYPVNVEVFAWSPLSAGGMTPLGKACTELNLMLLSDNGRSHEKIYIILLSDGCPTDDYDEGIEALQANPRFTNSNRFAIAIGDNAEIPSLVRFVEYVNHVYIQNNADELLDTLRSITYDLTTNKPNTSSADNDEIEEDDDEWA